MKHLGLFAAGVLFGTARSEDPQQQGSKKRLCAHHCSRPRAKDCVMQAVTARPRGCG